MSTIEKVKALNEEVRLLNNKREQMIGQKDVALKRFEELTKEYEATYGVKLTVDCVDEEYKKVQEATEREVKELERAIQHIKSGAYIEEARKERELHQQQKAQEIAEQKGMEVANGVGVKEGETIIEAPTQEVVKEEKPLTLEDGWENQPSIEKPKETVEKPKEGLALEIDKGYEPSGWGDQPISDFADITGDGGILTL